MPCLFAVFALVTPRLVVALLYFFTRWFAGMFDSLLWPILGFLFMPLTTLAYAWAINRNGSVSGAYFVVVLLAALIDLGSIGASRARRRARA